MFYVQKYFDNECDTSRTPKKITDYNAMVRFMISRKMKKNMHIDETFKKVTNRI